MPQYVQFSFLFEILFGRGFLIAPSYSENAVSLWDSTWTKKAER